MTQEEFNEVRNGLLSKAASMQASLSLFESAEARDGLNQALKEMVELKKLAAAEGLDPQDKMREFLDSWQ